MSISEKTRKIIWVEAGGRCAICKVLVLTPGTETDDPSVFGEEAHIVARSPGGPRAGGLAPGRLDSHDNLLLLCSKHHKQVDDQPLRYPVEELRRIKRDHAAWNAALAPRNRPVLVPDPRFAQPVASETLATGSRLWNLFVECPATSYTYPNHLAPGDGVLIVEFLNLLRSYAENIQHMRGARELMDAEHALNGYLAKLAERNYSLGAQVRRALAAGTVPGEAVAWYELHLEVRPVGGGQERDPADSQTGLIVHRSGGRNGEVRGRGALPLGRLATAAAGALVVAALFVVGWVLPETFDRDAAKDRIREAFQSDDDLRYSIEFFDEGDSLVLPHGFRLTDPQRQVLRSFPDDFDGFRQLQADLRAAGAANPHTLTLRVTLEGRRNQPIRIDDVRPISLRRTDPHSGTLLDIPAQSSGQTIRMMFDFDEADPRARIAVPDGGVGNEPGDLFFKHHTLEVGDQAEEVVVIESIIGQGAATFEIGVDYRIGGQAKRLVIDNQGVPFALTALNCTQRSRHDPQRHIYSEGHARYEEIWELSTGFTLTPVDHPDRYGVGSPYC
ncbi:HNH endonuclease signature motif containing protein [Polymorphospora sp. NPDC050346]|uniref:HNH endonuclease n=1 Tax=Polymorphospora sp. NPDC050346 TaxID=3155780 RepID=UPI0033FEB46C